MTNQTTNSTQPTLRALIADDAYCMTFQSLPQYRAALLQSLDALANRSVEASDEFERGYFCAVSTLLNEDGNSSYARSVFKQGGDPLRADPMDIERFIGHGLMERASKLDGNQGGGT
jgi:hypothetical protein